MLRALLLLSAIQGEEKALLKENLTKHQNYLSVTGKFESLFLLIV